MANEAPRPAVKKLTNWKNEPSVMDLKDDFDSAKPAQQTHITRVKKWNDLRNSVATPVSKINALAPTGRSKVQPKLIRRQAEWRYSALSEPFLSGQKLFNAEPATFEDEAAARQNELVLNHQFRNKLNKVKFVDEYVRTAVDEGTVVVRLGWQRETKMIDCSATNWMRTARQSGW